MAKKSSIFKGEYVVLLHDVRSVYNVGAIFRTVNALGNIRVVLSGYTPTPLDRFGRIREDFTKSAIGSEKTVTWEYKKTPYAFLKRCKEEGYQIIGIEQTKDSVDYKKIKRGEKMIIIFGTETTGISKTLQKYCDLFGEIPMNGTKESLNVSVAAGIALYRIFDIY